MNIPVKHKHLPWLILAAGILGALLRLWLYAAGTDDRGLLTGGHIAHWLLWLLTAGVAAVLILGVMDLKQAGKYSFNFPASLTGAVGAAAAAAGLLVFSLMELFSPGDSLTRLDAFLGLLCAAALAFLGFCRRKGLHPSVLFHGMICLYMMLHLVGRYRLWSSEPQIQDYFFPLMSTVCIMLSSFYGAAFAANAGSRRPHTLFHLAGVYFCLVSLPRCDAPLFYLAMGVWLFTDLCSLIPMPRPHRNGR